MKKTTHMVELWSRYAKVLPENASRTQVIETERAFYAGAVSVLSFLVTRLGPSEEPTEADLQPLDELSEELQAWAAALAAQGVRARGER